MRMGYDKNLQFLMIPLILFISNHPPLFPGPAINIQELNLIIQLLGGDIHRRSRYDVVGGRQFSGHGLPGPGRPREPGCGGGERKRTEPNEGGEEEEEREGETNGEEMCPDEIPEEGSPADFPGVFGFGVAGGGGGRGRGCSGGYG